MMAYFAEQDFKLDYILERFMYVFQIYVSTLTIAVI
jgi:hypothetical protein